MKNVKIINKILIEVILIFLIMLFSESNLAFATDMNFKVRFSGTPEVSDGSNVKALITNDLSATLDVTGLVKKGDYVTAKYNIENVSSDLSAKLSVETQNSNEEYFSVQSELGKDTLAKNQSTSITLTIKLIKEPIEESQKSTIKINLKAAPIQLDYNKGNNGSNQGQAQENQTNMPSTNKMANTNYVPLTGDSLPIIAIVVIITVIIVNLIPTIIKKIKNNKE